MRGLIDDACLLAEIAWMLCRADGRAEYRWIEGEENGYAEPRGETRADRADTN